MILIDMFKEKRKLIVENIKIRRGKIKVEQKYNKLLEEKDEVTTKYMLLLEQKSEQFDLYVKYQNQCIELAMEKKQIKKQLAESKESILALTKQNTILEEQTKKLESKIKHTESKKN